MMMMMMMAGLGETETESTNLWREWLDACLDGIDDGGMGDPSTYLVYDLVIDGSGSWVERRMVRKGFAPFGSR